MQIQHTDLSFEVYKRLKSMILSNEFKPGDKLVQEQIATMFGVSRMPLHKAFQMLENEMLVENLPRRGFYVTQIDRGTLIDAFECREVLEGLAIRKATEIISEDELHYLKSLFLPFVNKKRIDEKKYIEADQEFHRSIIRMSDNQILKRLDLIGTIISQTLRGGLVRPPEETLNEHLSVINAMEQGKGEEAEFLIRDHSRKSCQIIREKY